MGFLNLFSKPAPGLMRLPSGSFTVDRNGHVLVSTLPQSFPQALQRDLTNHVLETFRAAQAAQLPLSELVVHFACLKLTARDMRGGAIIFLTPINLLDPAQ